MESPIIRTSLVGVNDQLPYLSPKCSSLDRMLLPLSSLTELSDDGVLDSGYLLFSVSMIGVGSMGCLSVVD